MYFSGKITNSFVQYLSRQGVDTERLFDLTELPAEFLQDPSCWLNSSDVETFLAMIEKEFATKFQDANIMTTVGHACTELKAWGVLDGVLRMMQKPADIYSQPQRFISYFVSPAPPIGNLLRDQESISFDLPISNSEFPLATEYLRATIEALPLYVGQNMAAARWCQTKLAVSWSEAQESLLPAPDYVIKPELIRELVTSLEEAQRELEIQKQLVAAQSQELKSLKENRTTAPAANSPLDDERMLLLRSQVLRLSDYMTRAHQLVTLLVKQDRMDRQVQEAMRRVDWDYVSVQYREVIEDVLKQLDSIKQPTAKARSARSQRKRNTTEFELSVTN